MIKNGTNGWMDDDLQTTMDKALTVDRKSYRQFAEGYSWEACTQQFLSLIQPNRVEEVSEPEPAEKPS